jgi:hypothetical protein
VDCHDRKRREVVRFVTVYRHYRTGKLMYARKYGYKAWPFPATKKKS